MYGTVAKVHLKPGALAEFKRINGEDAGKLDGIVFEYFYQLDREPDTIMLVVAFRDRESYERNSNDPERARRYGDYRALMTSDPDWNDGEIVYNFPA